MGTCTSMDGLTFTVDRLSIRGRVGLSSVNLESPSHPPRTNPSSFRFLLYLKRASVFPRIQVQYMDTSYTSIRGTRNETTIEVDTHVECTKTYVKTTHLGGTMDVRTSHVVCEYLVHM